MKVQRPTIVTVSGFSSNVGKSALVCELLQRLAGWEAIKVTRGHYRSCGRDPNGCCVSDLLKDEPVIRSGRAANYESGKDTGMFWDAGAANVHWVIVKDGQMEQGIREALARVEAPGVVIEGNSFVKYVEPDLLLMCARSSGGKIKSTARRALLKTHFLYLSSLTNGSARALEEFAHWRASLPNDLHLRDLPLITRDDLAKVISQLQERVLKVNFAP
jgi:hypothetical protein